MPCAEDAARRHDGTNLKESLLHKDIESIAGAIALGEATDAERRAYRQHIAHCAQCLRELGGEHELARTAQIVATARDEEVWDPQLGNVFRRRSGMASPAVRFAAAFTMTFAAAAAAVHYLSVPAATPPSVGRFAENVVARRAEPQAPVPAPQRKLMVYHNVVQIARGPLAAPTAAPPSTAQKPPEKTPVIAAMTIYAPPSPQPQQKATVPVWREPAWRTVARTTTTSVSETAPQRVSSAEMLQIGTARALTNDARPIGGETAINPQPPMIAYSEGAEGTTAFEVLVDERGVPTKCVITKPAGYRFLDEAVCKAAMKAHYSPKTVDGRAVPGVYRDAFTFRVSSDASEGLPKPIH